ncbi:MAG: hypothetical protein AB9835_13855 [Eubacteriales bacterium]
MKNTIKLTMTAAVSLLLLTSCQNVRTSDGDVSLVGRSEQNGEVIEYKQNGEVIRNGKIGQYEIVDDKTVRVYSGNKRSGIGDLFPYSNNNGVFRFGQ